ncbi:germination protein YpeB [Priestia flexa]|uniref:germination protein YpeB n=1 Tax=Priestia flexa TaxID=86664 RepID=UPI0010FBD4B6|nr:germination protein YpeB [Priestia flexa]MCA1200485.1 germination protein YpeB [Priestia flexa]MCG7312034.1 germination protein YpeB [Priestia flexa]MCP1190444.1 germination protein YpeB [Priestia flexa]QCS52105.1 germination protein YpeB [Priestia flexa]
MIRTILITILAVGVVGVGYWGYTEHQEKDAVLLQAENTYQRAFHDLSYELDLLNDKIGGTLAMSSRDQLSPALAEVWRLTSEAHSNVGQLPLALLPFNKTEEFLSDIGDFAYEVAVRDLGKSPLTDKEYKTLNALYEKSSEIQNEMRTVQHLVIDNNLRWMDVELALATKEKQGDNTIIDGLKTVEKSMDSYAESDLGITNTSNEDEKKAFGQLKGREVDERVAKEVARSFLDLKGKEEMHIAESGKGANYPFYSLTIKDPSTKKEIYMDITKKGGYPIWVLENRDVKKQNISLNEAMEKANKFLKDHRFESLVMSESAQYDNLGVFTFVEETESGVRIYPDAVKMKMALDDGTVAGFSAKEFLLRHRTRDIPEPTITKEEAKSKLNPNLKVMEDRLAIIENDLQEEVLCYEFLGTINDDTYRIFVNAKTGFEEKVDKLQNAEPIYDEV